MNHARVYIKFGAERLSVRQAALRIGVSQTALWNRLHQGVPQEQLLKPGSGPRKKESPFRQVFTEGFTADQYLAAEGMPDNGRNFKRPDGQ